MKSSHAGPTALPVVPHVKVFVGSSMQPPAKCLRSSALFDATPMHAGVTQTQRPELEPSCASQGQRAREGRSSIRFRLIKRQFGLVKVRFRGLAKNTAHVVTLFALSKLWLARRRLMAMAVVRPRAA
jgi:hypothetical protein